MELYGVGSCQGWGEDLRDEQKTNVCCWLGSIVNVTCRKAVTLCKRNRDKKCSKNTNLKLTQIGKQSQ